MEPTATMPAWLVAENIVAEVVSSFSGEGGHSDDHTDLLITRESNPAETLRLYVNWNGDITINGQYVDLGDDMPVVRGIFDEVDESFNNHFRDPSAPWIPAPAGFRIQLIPSEIRDVYYSSREDPPSKNV